MSQEQTPTQAENGAKQKIAYMLQQGDNHMQYRAYRLVIEGDKIVGKEMIGTPDLKAIVFGRLLKLIFAMR